MIKILEQEFISEVGKRANNEDKCGYIATSTYVVCDGVGGLDKGEIASDIVCRSILRSFSEQANCTIEEALPIAESSMDAFLEENQNAIGMATTLTLAQIRENGIYVAWVGDSRVYQFRSGKVNFVTKDHSWVNDALKMGLITKEEAINHPKSNIITRAVQGASKPVKADSKLIKDLLPNDYFLLCSDGVLECWTDEELEDLFSSEQSCAQILNQLKLKCEKLSKDNFTAIAFKVEDAQIPALLEEEAQFVEAIPVTEYKEPFSAKIEKEAKSGGSGKTFQLAVIAFLFLAFVAGLFFFKDTLKKVFTEDNSPNKEQREPQNKEEAGQQSQQDEPEDEANPASDGEQGEVENEVESDTDTPETTETDDDKNNAAGTNKKNSK
jgi:protein phosphatase